jgi:Fe-S-cluster-containing dehydrogenase component
MGVNRREFMKIAGLVAAGAVAKPAIQALAVEHGDEQAAPGAERLAMVVDMKKCLREDGCQKCVDACHLVHNVPHFGNPKDQIKWIWKEQYENAFPNQENPYLETDLRGQDVLLLCNHCNKPPCVRVCPTKATFRRGHDGIVMMDMHRCIGCRFCIAACPYGARSFNWRNPRPFIDRLNPDFPTRTRGVVEKCNFCAERRTKADGRPPACVEACEQNALLFGDVNDPDSEVRRLLATRYSIRRSPGLGTNPQVYYLV